MQLRTMMDSVWSDISTLVFCTILTSSIALNLVLAMKYRQLVTRSHGQIQQGITLTSIYAKDIDGTPRTIAFREARPTVLYVLAPSCGWCARNLENIRTLSAQRGDAFRFIGLASTADGLKEYLRSTKLSFPVEVIDTRGAPSGLGLGITPQMAVVDPGGRVDRVWVGALQSARQGEVEEFFHLKLPGLVEPTAAVHVK